MAIRFTTGGSPQYLDAPDVAAATFPNGDWTLCFFLNVNGSVGAAAVSKYVVSTGVFGTAGTLHAFWQSNSSNVNLSLNGSFTAAGGTHASGWRLYALRRSGTTYSTRVCPILTTAPSDGSAVSQTFTTTLSDALDGAGLTIGARQSDKEASRLLNDTLTRVFRYDGALTDFEIARLAFGLTITDIGYNPAWYVPMTTADDFTDVKGAISFSKVGTPTTDTEPPFGYVAPTGDTITPTDFTNHKIFQRTGTSANIIFSGTKSGVTPTDVQVQLYAADGATVLQSWTTLTSATITSATFSGTLSVPQQPNMYRFAVRSRNSGSTPIVTSTVTTSQWGVGDIWALVGSSTPEKWANTSSGVGFTANAGVKRYSKLDVWEAGGTDGAIISMANQANTALGIAIGFMDSGQGGSLLVNWASTGNNNFIEFSSDLSNVGNKIALVLVAVGSNDAADGVVVSKEQHRTNYLTFINNIRTVTSQPTLPIFISSTSARNSANTQQFDWAREVEKDLGSEPNIYLGATTIDLPDSGDGVHPSDVGYQTLLSRMLLAVLDVFGSGTFHRGAFVSNIRASGNGAFVTITHVGGTDIVVNATNSGFTASDDVGALTITSATRHNATTVLLTFNRAISVTVVIKYTSGARPISAGQGVKDNTTLGLPLEIETEALTTSFVPSLIIQDVNAAANALSTTTNVILSEPTPQAVTVNFATANNTAIAGVDYTATSGTLTFAVGEITKTITVPLL